MPSSHPGPVEMTGGNFFTEKSYEDMADKRVDYGMLRFSSLSEVRGSELFGFGNAVEGNHNFSVCQSNDSFKSEQKCSLFLN